MKGKIFLLVLLLVTSVSLFNGTTLRANEITTKELPSQASYEKEVSFLNNLSQSTLMGSVSSTVERGADITSFDGFTGPGDGSALAPGGGTGGSYDAPLGNVTPAVVLVMLLFYMLFRRATTSKRKNL